MGILKHSREQGAGLSKVEREVTVSAFCRRRLAVIMARSGMVENIKTVCFFSFLLSLFYIIFLLAWLHGAGDVRIWGLWNVVGEC
jgi:hypothetical protein